MSTKIFNLWPALISIHTWWCVCEKKDSVDRLLTISDEPFTDQVSTKMLIRCFLLLSVFTHPIYTWVKPIPLMSQNIGGALKLQFFSVWFLLLLLVLHVQYSESALKTSLCMSKGMYFKLSYFLSSAYPEEVFQSLAPWCWNGQEGTNWNWSYCVKRWKRG